MLGMPIVSVNRCAFFFVCDIRAMRQLYKLLVTFGYAVTAAIVGQLAWNMASKDGAGLGWPAVLFAAVGGLAGWYRTG